MDFKRFPFWLLPPLFSQQGIQAAVELNDASRLNATQVSEAMDIRNEADVRVAILKAHLTQKHISIAGKRHSMGGQTLEKGNIVLNMLPLHALSYEAETGLLTAQSGASWHEIQLFLDPRGRAVWVMQSDTIFSVGGTLSVNAHGWQPRQGPIASTVESFRIMLASGEIKTCSRQENADLFHAALGGYGLLGVILDARLHTVPNKLYRQSSSYFPSKSYADVFQKAVADNPTVELAYGRLSIDKEQFLSEAGLHTFEVEATQPSPLPSMEEENLVPLKNFIFRKSAKSDTGKRRRWDLEKKLAHHEAGRLVTRNSTMSPDFRVIWNPMPASRDILQEYFVPYDKVNDFVEDLRMAVLRHDLNLLNVTLRDVRQDHDTLLAYAKSDVCALVLFISQPPTAAAEEGMRAFTESLVDRALALGGSFYLPYRLTYAPSQFLQAYPGAAKFARLKVAVDRDGLFSSQFSHYVFSKDVKGS